MQPISTPPALPHPQPPPVADHHADAARRWYGGGTGPVPGTRCRACPYAGRVWKDPNCGCCKDWVDHMQANGFKVTVHETGNNAVRAGLGLPQSWARATPPWWAATWWKAMCPPAMCAPCCSKAQGPGPRRARHARGFARHGRRRVWRPPRPYDVLLVAHDGSTRVFKSYNKRLPHDLFAQIPPAVVCAVCRSPAHQRPAWAQAPAADSHAAHHTAAANAQQADLSEGEVTRVDVAALKVTLRHGELKNLNMPPMTMVFRAGRRPARAAEGRRQGALSGRADQGRLLRHAHRKGPVNGRSGRSQVETGPP